MTAWADRKNGHTPTQSAPGSKPIYAPIGFNGRPGIVFDGVDDYLSLENQPLGTGAASREMWTLQSQSTPDATAVSGTIFAYGGTVSNANFVQRIQTAGVSRARGATGPGVSSTVSVPDVMVAFNGIHLVRYRIEAAQSSLYIDGHPSTTMAVVPNTGSIRVRIGSNIVDTAAAFFTGTINAILVTSLLEADPTLHLNNYLKIRGGIL